jgi:DNA repair protein RecO
MKQISTLGVVLSRTEYGEADRIITFLTPDHGKVRVMAKGVRKPRSKLAGGIELFSVSDITFIQGRGDLHTLVSSRLQTHFGNIVHDIDRTMLGYEFLKILSKLLEDEGGPEFYDLLVSTLRMLDNQDAPKDLAEASFLLRLMRLLGHLPTFTHDPKGQPLPKDGTYQFSFDDMAFFVASSGSVMFVQNHAKLLRLLSHNPPESLLKVTDLERYLADLAPLVRQMSRQYLVNF